MSAVLHPEKGTSKTEDADEIERKIVRERSVGLKQRIGAAPGQVPPPPINHAELTQRGLERLELRERRRSVNDEVLSFVGSQSSISQLSFCVNDSAAGKTFEEVYDIGDVLGEGGFAYVYRSRHKERGQNYAVKEVYNENYDEIGSNVRNEISALKKLREGPFVVRLLDVFEGPETTFLVMEELKGGDLLEKIVEKEVYPEKDARRVCRTLLEAVFFCHKKRIAHRDIKPENILLVDPKSDTKIKLGDFGCAHPITGPNCMRTLCGSPQYVAPELYMHQNGYDERCDLWSVGIVMFVLLGGYAPFEAPTPELPALISDGYFQFHHRYWKDISDPPQKLIKKLLKVDPDDRFTVEQALDSEWLRRRDMELLNDSMRNFNLFIRKASGNDSVQSSSFQSNSFASDRLDRSLHSIADILSDSEKQEGDKSSSEEGEHSDNDSGKEDPSHNSSDGSIGVADLVG